MSGRNAYPSKVFNIDHTFSLCQAAFGVPNISRNDTARVV